MTETFAAAPLFVDHMPIEVLQWGDGDRGTGKFVIATDFAAKHLNLGGSVHGGLIATMLDVALAGGAYADREEPRKWYGLTVTMTVNYVRGTGEGRAICEAWPVGGGYKTKHVEAVMTDGEGPVATATAVIKVVPRPGT